MMPGMDGYEVCARLKQNPVTARIPVLFVSSRDDEEDEARGLSLGAIDYIVKPIRPSIVQARVRNHIELKRSRDLLEQLTTQDHLTGISNRRRFDYSLAQEWQRAAREQTPLSLVAIDIDHFKAYNDHYGHPQGDQCLIRVARALATCVTRPTDLVARCGGEEFAGLLPSTDSTGAARLAGQMRAAIEAEGLEHARSPTHPHVTISLGVATVVPQAQESASSWWDLADVAPGRRPRVRGAMPLWPQPLDLRRQAGLLQQGQRGFEVKIFDPHLGNGLMGLRAGGLQLPGTRRHPILSAGIARSQQGFQFLEQCTQLRWLGRVGSGGRSSHGGV